jgi:hypothetical protein
MTLSGLDLDGAVAAGGLDEFADGPAGPVPGPSADRRGGEDDGRVGFGRVAQVVVDGPGRSAQVGPAQEVLQGGAVTLASQAVQGKSAMQGEQQVARRSVQVCDRLGLAVDDV